MPRKPIYLDYHATTPVDPRVWAAMEPYYTTKFGNPASNSHAFGWEAAQAVQKARAQVATLLGAEAAEIVFTSGATESDNLAVKGVAELQPERRGQIITTTIEHSAVLDPCQKLEAQGYGVTRLAVGRDGRVGMDELERALEPGAILISVIAANNEIGVVQDMVAIGERARARGVVFHSDATQAVGKIPVDVQAWGVDLLSLSGHKMYGPKGVGALYVRKGTRLHCQLDGGGHERGMRSGTLNVPGIVGLGEAAELARLEMEAEGARIAGLRDRLSQALTTQLSGVRINGSTSHRVPHNLHVTFEAVEADALMMSVYEIAISAGSACASAHRASSHVLRAIGLSDEEAHRSVRIGLGRFTTAEEIDCAAGRLIEAVSQLRQLTAP